MTIEAKKEKVLAELATIGSTEKRYEYLIQKGRELPPLADERKQDKYLVKGCISRAWLVPSLEEGRIHFAADSEAAIVKGILAVLLEVYNENPPGEVLELSPEFLKAGGITDHLSLNRRNGLAHFCKQIQLYATAYKTLVAQGISSQPPPA